jgi:hypothetical protein
MLLLEHEILKSSWQIDITVFLQVMSHIKMEKIKHFQNCESVTKDREYRCFCMDLIIGYKSDHFLQIYILLCLYAVSCIYMYASIRCSW